MARPIRLLIADDSPHARAGLRAMLTTWPELSLVGEAGDGIEAVRLAAELLPDIVLMDLTMPHLDGLEATRQIKRACPGVTVVVLTVYALEQGAALDAGADSLVIKGSGAERLLAALGIETTPSEV